MSLLNFVDDFKDSLQIIIVYIEPRSFSSFLVDQLGVIALLDDLGFRTRGANVVTARY